MLRFLVDESSGKKLSDALNDAGYDALYCGEVLKEADDKEVLEEAKRDRRILITNDKDFGELIFRQLRPSCGVILMRLRVDTPENRIKHILSSAKNFGGRLYELFVILSDESTRTRNL